MANTYYDSQLTGEEIESALEAIDGVITPANNGKVLMVESGQIVAKSVQEISGDVVLDTLNVSANGDYYPPQGTTGYDEVHVSVNYEEFEGATEQTAGEAGLVPAPAAGGLRVLTSDGVWTAPDAAPTEDSETPLSSGGAYDALKAISDSLEIVSETYTINGVTFLFRKRAGHVDVLSYGACTNEVAVGSYMGSIQLANDFLPATGAAFITYIQATATRILQVNISLTGAFQVGYPNEAVAAGTTLRMAFGYCARSL